MIELKELEKLGEIDKTVYRVPSEDGEFYFSYYYGKSFSSLLFGNGDSVFTERELTELSAPVMTACFSRKGYYGLKSESHEVRDGILLRAVKISNYRPAFLLGLFKPTLSGHVKTSFPEVRRYLGIVLNDFRKWFLIDVKPLEFGKISSPNRLYYVKFKIERL